MYPRLTLGPPEHLPCTHLPRSQKKKKQTLKLLSQLWNLIYTHPCISQAAWSAFTGLLQSLGLLPWALRQQGHSHVPSAVVVFQLLSNIWLFMIPWTAAHLAPLSVTNSQSLLKLMSTESVMLSNHLILCHPLYLLPSVFPSIRVFSRKWALHIRYWTFCFSISPSNEYSGLISFRIDWFDLLMVLHVWSSIHDYWKTIALTSFDLHWVLPKWKKG